MVATTTTAPLESASRSSTSLEFKRFFQTFFRARGATEILVVSTLLAFGIGSIIGLIPETFADRYARINHGYHGAPCASFDRIDKPLGCQHGADEAQSTAAWSNFCLCLLSLIFNPVLGSVSDKRGRRLVLLLGLFLNCMPSAVFLVLLRTPALNPDWYYAFSCLSGVVNYVSIIFAILSDVIPDEFRAPGYGVVMAGFYGGFALAPSLPLLGTPNEVAFFSFLLILASFLVAVFTLPETLALEIRQEYQRTQAIRADGDRSICNALMRPIREVAILNHSFLIRLVTASSFLSSMVSSSDGTLVIYYLEEQLNVRLEDFAAMFLVLGITGIVVQGGLIQPAVSVLGEKNLLVTTFACGTLHNCLYGIARSKGTIYVALILAQWSRVNLPILSSLASKHASPNEQGRMQGALFATNSIANAVGPLCMEYAYRRTENNPYVGPGFMFFVAAGLYFTGTVLVSLITTESPTAATNNEDTDASRTLLNQESDLEEPLLASTEKADTDEPMPHEPDQ